MRRTGISKLPACLKDSLKVAVWKKVWANVLRPPQNSDHQEKEGAPSFITGYPKHSWSVVRDTWTLFCASFPCLPLLSRHWWVTVPMPLLLVMLYKQLPVVLKKKKEPQQQQKTPNHKTPNSSLVHMIPSHCEPIPCPQPARTSSASSSCGRHLWQLHPSRFSFFSSPITLFSLSGSPEDLTFSGFQALSTPRFPLATLLFILHDLAPRPLILPLYSGTHHTSEAPSSWRSEVGAWGASGLLSWA